MGQISRTLEARFQKALHVAGEKARRQWDETVESTWDTQRLIDDGHMPLHAAYLAAQNFLDAFAATVLDFAELQDHRRIVSHVANEYTPVGPPLSSLTVTYFSTWSMLDVRCGPDGETIGTCLLELADMLGLEPAQVETLRAFQGSRMGIYEQTGEGERVVRLRELLTGLLFSGFGYLLETVPSALYILTQYADRPEEAIVRAVNDTWDNDTIAAIVGAAVGALHGEDAIPQRWIANLAARRTGTTGACSSCCTRRGELLGRGRCESGLTPTPVPAKSKSCCTVRPGAGESR